MVPQKKSEGSRCYESGALSLGNGAVENELSTLSLVGDRRQIVLLSNRQLIPVATTFRCGHFAGR